MTKHVLLVEPNYYSQYPPIGLLKLSTYHKQMGNTTELVRKNKFPKKTPDLVYVTSLFTWAWRPVWKAVRTFKAWFPDVDIWLGGLYASLLPDHARLSGADRVYQGVFEEAEDLMPDYSLVPNWNGSIIFASRGCNKKCVFCAVPRLEGRIHSCKKSVKHLIWQAHTKIIFFDNNILASPFWKNVFDEMIELGLSVDFNQGLDARLLSEEAAQKISQMKISIVRLAYDLPSDKSYVKRAINLLHENGIYKRDILVYALYNFTESPNEYLERVRDILRWGAVCYPMRFQPCDTLKKNSHVSKKWDEKRLDMIQRARRVIGYGGAFPPYEGLVKKFEKAKNFGEAFVLYPSHRSKKTKTGTNLKQTKLEPVKELPPRRLRKTLYDELVSDFLRSGEKYAEVSVEGKKSATVLSALRKRAKGKGIVVRSINGKVYLERE